MLKPRNIVPRTRDTRCCSTRSHDKSSSIETLEPQASTMDHFIGRTDEPSCQGAPPHPPFNSRRVPHTRRRPVFSRRPSIAPTAEKRETDESGIIMPIDRCVMVTISRNRWIPWILFFSCSLPVSSLHVHLWHLWHLWVQSICRSSSHSTPSPTHHFPFFSSSRYR